MQATNNYNYETFSASLYTLDAFDGPKVGEEAVDFTATTLDGQRVKLSDYYGKPIILETGSFTCPQYVARINPMNQFATEYPEFEFLVLYVREAHPGDNIGNHASTEEKTSLAQRTRNEEGENRTILVDDLNGTVHQAYGSLPNMFYVIDADGTILARSDWNDTSAVRNSLEKLKAGESLSDSQYGFRPVAPPVVIRVLSRAGGDAVVDFFTNLPALILGHIKAALK